MTLKTSENKVNVMTYLLEIAVSIIAAYFIVRYLIRRFSKNTCCRSICSSFCSPIVINNRINSTDIAIQQPQDLELIFNPNRFTVASVIRLIELPLSNNPVSTLLPKTTFTKYL